MCSRSTQVMRMYITIRLVTVLKLKYRLNTEDVSEVILALNSTIDGQTTAHYIADELHNDQIQITSLAQGVPIGGELDYLDDGTISAALNARKLF